MRDRIIGLDIFRTIAIILVVYNHSCLLNSNLIPINIDGVSIFFVLSGFLIGKILLGIITDTSFTKWDLINFWIRRWFRTLPNYFLIVTLILSYKVLVLNKWGEFSYKYIFFIQNFWSPNPRFFPESWSLSVEEWFYILFPATCFIFHRFLKNKYKSILISALVFIIIPLSIRIIKYELGIGIDNIDENFRKIVVLRLDSLMYGIIGAYAWFNCRGVWYNYRFYFFIAGAIILLSNLSVYQPISFNLESITFLLFLPYLSSLKSTGIEFINKIFVFLSSISYSMYLINFSIVLGFLIPKTSIFIGSNFNYFLFWAYTIFISYAIYTFYEKPITKIRDFIIKK